VAKQKFAYIARDSSGKEQKGQIEAENEAEANTKLKQQQLVVTGLKRVDIKPAGFLSLGAVSRKANTAELALFTRQMATMIGAGIPLLEAFEILSEQTMDTNKGFGMGLRECADMVRGGTELSEAMLRFPRIFPEIYVNMVKAGEASGQLDIILDRLADFLESNESLKREIKSAMTYPVISLILVFGITAYLLMFVVPKFEAMFKSLNAKLPGITVFVLDCSYFMQNQWYIIFGGAIAVFAGYKMAMTNRDMRRLRDTFWLKAPVFGPLSQKVALSRFSRTLSTLLASGVPLLAALEIVASTAGNTVIEDTLLDTRDTVKRGESITSHLQKAWVFPPMVVRMIGIGEKSGALEQLLSKISDFYDEQIHATVKALTSLIEPIMLAIMGTVVGTIVVAIFYPILELQKQLS
jgi:type IV pilus assembly protein PilC